MSALTDALRQVGGLTCNAAADEIERLRAEVKQYRETNRRLNARAQAAEKAVHEKIANYPHRSLGRALANTAADMYRREGDAARAERDWLIEKATRSDVRVIVNPWTGFFVIRPGDNKRHAKHLAYAPPSESVAAAIRRVLDGEDPEEQIRESIKRDWRRAAREAEGEG